jgi:hypothetical protein
MGNLIPMALSYDVEGHRTDGKLLLVKAPRLMPPEIDDEDN